MARQSLQTARASSARSPGKASIRLTGASTEFHSPLRLSPSTGTPSSSSHHALARAGGIEGLDYERFFEHFARSWAAVYSPAYADSLLADAHAPSNLRVNASAQMLEEFYATYGAADGNAMYLAPEDRITLWGKSSS